MARTLIYRRLSILAIVGMVGVIGVACGSSSGNDVPDLSGGPEAASQAGSDQLGDSQGQSGAVAESAEASTGVSSEPYDPTEMMYRIFPGFGLAGANALAALEEVATRKDTSQVAVLADILRYMSSALHRERVADTLAALTGQTFSAEEWKAWKDWSDEHREEFPPPEGFIEWKRYIFRQIDPYFHLFLRTAEETSRIEVAEIEWGGVLVDGIPDLREPRMIPPEEAGYLQPHERVYGVSINGDNRAYPLRIANAHEMVNDVVGGEPIALSW